MKSKENVKVIALDDGREVCFSYDTVVAAFLPGQGYVKTDRKYSVTTSRHANQYAGHDAKTIADTQLRQAIAPLTSK